MDEVQERMYKEYERAQVGHFHKDSYKNRLKRAGEEGLLIFIKYALVLVLAFFALNYLTSVISGAANGTNAVLYLTELQNKGYLPKVVNGQVPPKEPVAAKE